MAVALAKKAWDASPAPFVVRFNILLFVSNNYSMPILVGDALQQCDQLLNLLVGGGPAGADAHHRVRVVGLFHEAEAYVAL